MINPTILQAQSASSLLSLIGVLLFIGVIGYIIFLIRKQNNFLGNYDKSYFNLVRLFTGLKILAVFYGVFGILIIFFAFDKIANMLSFTSQFRSISESDSTTAILVFLFFLCAVFLQSYIGYAIGEWGIRYIKSKASIPGNTTNTEAQTEFKNTIHQLDMTKSKHDGSIATQENNLQEQKVEKLRQLKQLLDTGILTREEFEQQKKDIILNG